MKTTEQQLINGYLDGSLNAAEEEAFSRLFASDGNFAREAAFLIRQAELLAADKPAIIDVREGIKQRLTYKQNRLQVSRFGIRRFFNAAAIILMAIVFSGVLWLIFSPAPEQPKTQRSMANEQSVRQETAISLQAPHKTYLPIPHTQPLKVALQSYHLKAKTFDVIKAERFFSQVLYERGLLALTQVRRGNDYAVYRLECSDSELAEIVSQLPPLWAYIQEAKLNFTDLSHRVQTNVAKINPHQLADIVNQSSLAEKLDVAKSAAIVNNLPSIPAAQEYLPPHTPANLLSLRPVLASAQPHSPKTPQSPQTITVEVEFILSE